MLLLLPGEKVSRSPGVAAMVSLTWGCPALIVGPLLKRPFARLGSSG